MPVVKRSGRLRIPAEVNVRGSIRAVQLHNIRTYHRSISQFGFVPDVTAVLWRVAHHDR